MQPSKLNLQIHASFASTETSQGARKGAHLFTRLGEDKRQPCKRLVNASRRRSIRTVYASHSKVELDIGCDLELLAGERERGEYI
jgi:hypothetical protein